MSPHRMFLSTAIIIVVMVGLMSVFTIKQTELGLMLFLGKITRADFKPGLHFKIPILHQIRKFDVRVLNLDVPSEQFLTAEKKNLIVDSFIKWRIEDVVKYFTATGGIEQRAGQRLAEIVADGLRSEFGKRTIQEVVSGDRAKIMDIITADAHHRSEPLGIKVVDLRIKRIELPKEVSSSVYHRMEAERERVAKELRSRGEAAAVRIRAEADRESVEVVAKAERDAEQIRGEGDAISAKVYADSFGKNAEFYTLYRSLNAYKKVFGEQQGNILLLDPNSDFFNYFKHITPQPLSSEKPPADHRSSINENSWKVHSQETPSDSTGSSRVANEYGNLGTQ